MRQLLLFLLLSICFGTHGVAQRGEYRESKTQAVRISEVEQSREMHVLVKDKNTRLQPQCTYYWYKNQKVHFSRGDYEGQLLHGDYAVFYRSKNLKEKGTFDKGLKEGTWKSWYPNGEIASRTNWKKGRLHGVKITYSETGKLLSIDHYKKGKLHGTSEQFDADGTSVTAQQYKKGIVLEAPLPIQVDSSGNDSVAQEVPLATESKVETTPKNAEPKPATTADQETADEATESSEANSKKPWWKRLFSRKEKEETPTTTPTENEE